MRSFLIASALLLLSAFAAEEKKAADKSPDNVEITSRTLDYDHTRRIAIFRRDVKAVSTETVMTADKMTCFFDENNEIYRIVAEGTVIITKGTQKSKSEKAEYLIPEKTFKLRERPVLHDGPNIIKARSITVYEEKNYTDLDDPEVTFYYEEEKTPAKK